MNISDRVSKRNLIGSCHDLFHLLGYGAITVIAEKTVEYAVAQCQYKENNRQDDECLGEEFHFNTSRDVLVDPFTR